MANNAPTPAFPSETPDPEQLIKDWRGMADEYGREARSTSRGRVEALVFCADALQLWLKEVQGQHLALLPHDVLAVIHAAMHLRARDMQSLEDLIDAAENMKFGLT
jgi:hypothetical protein